MQETLSVKVPAEQKARLVRIARRRKTTPSQLLRESLERILTDKSNSEATDSCYAHCEDLFDGLGEGPADLSTNKRHLDSLGK